MLYLLSCDGDLKIVFLILHLNEYNLKSFIPRLKNRTPRCPLHEIYLLAAKRSEPSPSPLNKRNDYV